MALLLLGIGLLIAAIVTGVEKRGFIHRALSAPGVVTRLNHGGSHPEIEFTAASGERITYPQGGGIFGYVPGDAVRVLYSPENPRGTASIDAFGALWFPQLMLLSLGLGMSIGGGCLLSPRCPFQ